ncbi:hypothetical protein GGS23DRAFT_558813 [Durotheca rogersii]|uniref:uncharacterized protein n=1 Tax=Durotheca rogersii TaxID=419775 RepID=UPI00221F9EFB|nr:uncharacterized protein GGS23DRAFT_558813 [Durotheca rogersii]KAI5865353.1 hypothetical protein GGS23DRAFT_558813 [Durotheca rogersii]
MCLFMGAVLINSTPRLFRFISGYVVGWTCYILLRRVAVRCLPFVEERLIKTVKLKTDPNYEWIPPVGTDQVDKSLDIVRYRFL